MTRSTEKRIADILQAIERCQRYAYALDDDNMDLFEMAEDAVERNLQIIGEAANQLPPHVTDAHPEIAWQQIRGFRNILVHRYFGVDAATVRDVIQSHLPTLATALQRRDK